MSMTFITPLLLQIHYKFTSYRLSEIIAATLSSGYATDSVGWNLQQLYYN